MSVRGYVPGVFDLFHIGHLRILQRARGRCDVLVAGVVTDEVAFEAKGRMPLVPLEERLEIVSSLTIVDEAVVDRHVDKRDSWEDVRYDVLFKGSDWEGTERARKLDADLAPLGASLRFFPYTETTSSTKLREILEKL